MSANDSAPNGATKVWNGLLGVAGAAAGLTALVYLVGALTIWARLRAAGLPADIAAEHTPRGEALALGLRGIAAVGVGIAVAVAIAYGATLLFTYSVTFVAFVARRIQSRHAETTREAAEDSKRRPGSEAPPAVSHQRRDKTVAIAKNLRENTLLDVAAGGLRRIHVGTFRIMALVGFASVLVAGRISWHVFALTLALAVTAGGTLRYLYRRAPDRTRPSIALVVLAVLTAAVAGTAWQIQPPIHVQTVVISASVASTSAAHSAIDGIPGVKEHVPLPYLGETGEYVYVAEVKDVKRDEKHGRYSWTYTKVILELPRRDVSLAFPAGKGELAPQVTPPLKAIWSAIF